MLMLKDYPGTLQHQHLLRAVVSYYADDPRVLAVAVFGSLGRGDWDAHSDLDLDVVIADAAQVEMSAELRQLTASFASIDEQAALIIPDGDDAGDIVLKSLMRLSIRYHPLAATSPDIVDSLQLLAGRIDGAVLEAAGLANRRPEGESLDCLLDRCVRHAIEVDIALRRGQIWSAVELLHYMRKLLMELFTRTHHGKRAYQFFQAKADLGLQTRLGAALPRYDLKSIQETLMQIIDVLQHDLEALSDGQVQLTAVHAELLNSISSRQVGF